MPRDTGLKSFTYPRNDKTGQDHVEDRMTHLFVTRKRLKEPA